MMYMYISPVLILVLIGIKLKVNHKVKSNNPERASHFPSSGILLQRYHHIITGTLKCESMYDLPLILPYNVTTG